MSYRIAFVLLALQPVTASADHGDTGVFKAIFWPLTVGAPLESDDASHLNATYSGIRFTILDGAPDDLVFNTNQAAWLGAGAIDFVDSPTEQSFVTLDPAIGFPLERSPDFVNFVDTPAGISDGPWGLLIGDIYSGPLPSFDEFDHPLVQFLSYEYRLPGSTDFETGRISAVLFIPEPSSLLLLWPALPFLRRTRRTGPASESNGR